MRPFLVITCGDGLEGVAEVLNLRVVYRYGPPTSGGRPGPFDLVLANQWDGSRDEGIDWALRVIEVHDPAGALLVDREIDNYEWMRLALRGYETQEDAGVTLVHRPGDSVGKTLTRMADALLAGAH